MSITSVGSRDMMYEWMKCLLRVLLMMWIGWLMCSTDSTSLRSHRRSNPTVAPLVACLPRFPGYLGRCVRVLQSGIRAWFTPQTGWVVCVCHACMLVACVSLTLAFHVLVALHNVDHDCSKVIMRNLMLNLWYALS